MEKLKLNVEDLRVQSFVTDEVDEQKGTVQGQEVAAARSRFFTHCCETNEVQSCPVRCTP